MSRPAIQGRRYLTDSARSWTVTGHRLCNGVTASATTPVSTLNATWALAARRAAAEPLLRDYLQQADIAALHRRIRDFA